MMTSLRSLTRLVGCLTLVLYVTLLMSDTTTSMAVHLRQLHRKSSEHFKRDVHRDNLKRAASRHHDKKQVLSSPDANQQDDSGKTVRLVNTDGDESKGRLEVYHNGQWGTVCDDGFTKRDANVACISLGFARGKVLGYVTMPEGTGQIWLDEVSCTGSESSITLCPSNGWGVHNCGHTEDVSIQCLSAGTTAVAENSLRLLPLVPNQPDTGILEIYHDGEWGRICPRNFRRTEARVACKALGYLSGVAVTPNNSGADSTQPLFFNRVNCAGTESTIADCSHGDSWESQSCHYGDGTATVKCSNEAHVVPTGVAQNAVQLVPVDDENKKYGRLEIFHNSEWGTVCDDSFSKKDAVVACRNLGFVTGTVRSNPNQLQEPDQYSTQSYYATQQPLVEQIPIWLDDVKCSGTEKILADCSHAGWGEDNCAHIEDVYIECSETLPVSTEVENSVRLVVPLDGDQSTGRLEIYHDGEWGTVCDDDFSYNEAKVACVSLNAGYLSGVIIPPSDRSRTRSDSPYSISSGQGPTVIWLDDVQCTGTENGIASCRHSDWEEHNCGHQEDVVLRCLATDDGPPPPTQYRNGDVYYHTEGPGGNWNGPDYTTWSPNDDGPAAWGGPATGGPYGGDDGDNGPVPDQSLPGLSIFNVPDDDDNGPRPDQSLPDLPSFNIPEDDDDSPHPDQSLPILTGPGSNDNDDDGLQSGRSHRKRYGGSDDDDDDNNDNDNDDDNSNDGDGNNNGDDNDDDDNDDGPQDLLSWAGLGGDDDDDDGLGSDQGPIGWGDDEANQFPDNNNEDEDDG